MRALANLGVATLLLSLPGCGSGTATIVTFITRSGPSTNTNAPPIAVVGDAAFVVNPDGRRGIPVHFQVSDREGETVDVVFQWRRPDQTFDDPDLRLPENATREEIAPLLADPAYRRAHQVATEMPVSFGGTIARVDASRDPAGVQVRLPELTGPAAGLLARGLVGRELEILTPGGSTAQRRQILAYNPNGFTATVDVAFSPPLTVDQQWRISKRVNPIVALPQGVSDTFVWDSDDASIPRDVFMRAIPVDHVVGVPGETSIAKRLSPRVDLTNVEFPDPNTAPLPSFAAAADLDGDGFVDLVAASTGASDQMEGLLIFFQKRRGEFTPDPAGPVDRGFTQADPLDVDVADMDGDGKLDLVSANARTPSVTIFHQTSTPGTFELTPTVLLVPNPSARPTSIAIADFDGDGRLDIVSANDVGNDVTVFLQSRTTPGTFVPQELRPRPIDQPKSVAVGDLDGDGLLDIVCANGRGDCLSIFLQLADGAFPSSPSTNLVLPTGSSPVGVAVADVNADGKLDVISANQRSDNVTIFLQQSTVPGEFEQPGMSLGNRALTRGASAVAAADVDGDGNIDVVVANTVGNNVAVFFQTLPGVFEFDPRGTLGDSSSTNGPKSVALSDVDGDGFLDIVTANAGGQDLAAFFHPRRGTFSLDARGPLGGATITSKPVGVAVGDLDGDGDLDLVCANQFGDSLTVFRQTTPSQFNLAPGGILSDPASTIFPLAVAAGDLNGDGRLDIVSANRNTHTLGLFYQTTPGLFAFVGTLPVPFDPDRDASFGSLALADLNDDGHIDIVFANEATDALEVFLQASRGGFGAGSEVRHLSDPDAFFGPDSVAVADIDGDGLLDVVCANPVFDNLAIFYAVSPRVFATTAQTVDSRGATSGPISVAVGDVDGDGRPDLVCANQNSGDVSIFFQGTTPRSFGRNPTILSISDDPDAFTKPLSVVIGDFDGDGDLDVATANSESNTVTVFFQTAPRQFPSEVRETLGGMGVPEQPVFIATGDLDGDGELDLITANTLGNDLTIFYGGH
ncbi:MAG: VCBS repeat-containing protein [Planctomycetes bacterium]|nr:VCBS repeat-containing protein [Planctomycetota bacterium]